ncbi:hypothetical protein ABNF97_14480 [Plantactinospora sp. B6F1]|uniref:hypothetical protein n=1 Tax=Plantactinospora sp. B6F1 TaxID=3158971 RepID=UPI0032D8CA10
MKSRCRRTGVVLVVVGIIATTGCGPQGGAAGPPSGAAGPVATTEPAGSADPADAGPDGGDLPTGVENLLVSLTRVGGLDGPLLRNLVVTKSGDWVYIDMAKAQTTTRGVLTEAQHSGLLALLADPGLTTESEVRPLKRECEDRVKHSVTDGRSIVVMWYSCGPAPKIAGAIYSLLSEATPY